MAELESVEEHVHAIREARVLQWGNNGAYPRQRARDRAVALDAARRVLDWAIAQTRSRSDPLPHLMEMTNDPDRLAALLEEGT